RRRRQAPSSSQDSRPSEPACGTPSVPTRARTEKSPQRASSAARDQWPTIPIPDGRLPREFPFARSSAHATSRRLWQAVRHSTREKRGAGRHFIVLLPELVHELPQRTVLETETIGDFLLRTPFQKYRTQRLIATMIGMRGLGEELPATSVIHDQSSSGKNVSRFSKANYGRWYSQNSMRSTRIVAKSRRKPRFPRQCLSA